MSYEKKALEARASVAALRRASLDPCTECGGTAVHAESCTLLSTADPPGLRVLNSVLVVEDLDAPLTLEQVKAHHVAFVLRKCGWNKTHAAKALDVDRRTLYQMIDRYAIQVPR